MRSRGVDLSGKNQLPPEWMKAECEGCEMKWSATGTLESRRKVELAQAHATRLGHRIDLQWANRR